MRLGIAASDLMGVFFNIKSSCLCIVLAIGRLWKSLCTQFVYFLSFYLLLMYILHAIYCVISLSAIINTPQLFQHDLFITLCHFLISFEHMFSIHPWFTSFFFFSLSLSLVSTSHHGLFHDALHGYYYWLSHVFIWPQRGSLCPIWTAFCPLPCPKSLWMSQCAWHLSQPGER